MKSHLEQQNPLTCYSKIKGKLADAATDFVLGALSLSIFLSFCLSGSPPCNVASLVYNEG